LNGAIEIPAGVLSAIPHMPASVDAVARSKVSADVAVNLSFSVMSPVTVAVGKGDRRAEWVIEPADEPLIGDQELFFTVLTPLVADEIEMSASVQATISSFDFVPCLLRSPPIKVTAFLQ
jgi:hypothetical protein